MDINKYFIILIKSVKDTLYFCFSDEEQQKNCHTGQGGEHQEEALSGVPTKHGQTAQAGDIRGHQEEVQKGNLLLAILISLSNTFLSNHDIFFPLGRSYQKMPSSIGLISTSRQHKSALMHIGMWTSVLISLFS